jgi:serine/threonine-protein kinase HipA
LFWLLAATDGHGKNFSLYLEAENRYRLPPLYDIISAYPLMQKNTLPKQKVKMAMAVRGKKNYYYWDQIQARHFITTANLVNFPEFQTEQILWEMLNQVDTVIAQVVKILPNDFPQHISKPIFQGMRTLSQTQLRSRSSI